jgi:hypothetical protein
LKKLNKSYIGGIVMESKLKDLAVSIALIVEIVCFIALIGLAGSVDTDQMTIGECIPKMIVTFAIMGLAAIVLIKCGDDRDEYEKL